MRYVISISGSVLALLALNIIVSTSKPVFFHPYWHDKAYITGAITGIVLVVILFVVEKYKAPVFKKLSYLAFVGMIISVAVTWRYAAIFVNSADFEASAGKIWYVSYHVFLTMFVPVIAIAIQRLLPAKF